ncbi:MAG: WD40 repeat domain-containing protein, partial [Chitinophagaceae bacterium]
MKILLTCLLAFVGLTLYGQPVTPFLTIETGMHKARISQTSADASGRYILTGSEDKTARLWDAETGVLLNTLRIPVAPGDEGKVAACALSPDGKIAALGGITGYEWDEKFSIYLVSTQTNEIIFRIKNIPGPISDLEFSPDGKCLASVNSDSNLEIYDTRNWLLSSTVKGVSGISFDITNRIAAFSIIDKTVKLFDSKLKLIAETTVDYMPWAVSFSADNKLLAISSYNYPIAVEVRNAYDLSLLYKPNTDNNFASIGTAFDKTSNKLYAWGSSGEANLVRRGEGAPVLRIWENNGQGSYTDITISENFTFLENAITLPGGKMVVLNNGEIVVINSTGKIFWHSTGNLSYGYGSQDHFRINNTGTGIGFTPDFEPSFTFNVLKRQLLQEQSLSPPFSDNNNITKITSWNSRIEGGPPVINQVPANFVNETNEAIRAVDINQDGREVVLAGFYYLIKADNKANPIWGSPLPYVSLAVNISGDDKMVACLIGDGTIRWYSMKDGETLLTFYLHPDKKRWVLFTPFGYYDASPGAEDFLGWHLNNGPDKTPDFYPVSRFKEQFYRPDVIDAIFETYNEEQAITLADSRSTKK